MKIRVREHQRRRCPPEEMMDIVPDCYGDFENCENFKCPYTKHAMERVITGGEE